MTFALTKIQPPRPRAGSIDRGPLEAGLAAALATTRVSLLCAPAGYGKTTLLARALARLPPDHAVAWFSADEGDDLHGALECLLAALDPFDPPWRSAPERLLQRVAASEAEQRAVVAELINTLEACEVAHGVMVIDDLHRIEDPAFFRFVDALMARLGTRWSLAFATRTEPPLALARLRASGELAEFRQLQLRFAHEEARRLAAAACVDAAQADHAFERTQGWPAGLGMALTSLLPQPDARSTRDGERSIFTFLLAEVLDRLRPELAEFLLDVSVLPELDAARCEAVSGQHNAAALIDEIERLGLLAVVLDAPSPVLRLHDLFREALQQRLALRDPARLKALRQRAADTEPDAIRRIALLIAAEAYPEAARLVLAAVPERLARTGPATVLHLLAAFPSPFRETSPELALVRGLVGWVSWDFPGMRDNFGRAEQAFEAVGDAGGADLARAYHAHGLIQTGRIADARQLLARLDGCALPLHTRALALNARYWLAIDEGRLGDVAPVYAELLEVLQNSNRADIAYQTTPPLRLPFLPGVMPLMARHAELLLRITGDEPTPNRALAILAQAWVAAWRGDMPEAHRLRELARAEAAWSGSSGAVLAHLLTHAAICLAISGDRTGAMAAARERARRHAPHIGTWGRYVTAALVVRITAACGDAEALREALQDCTALAAELRAAGLAPDERMTLPAAAQLAWLEGRPAAAIDIWRTALGNEEAIDFYGQAAETRVRLARAQWRARNPAAAAATLAPALAVARERGGAGGALLAGEALCELAEAPWASALAAADVALLRAWARACDAGPARAAPPESGLSARELEVLERIAAGDSNKLIARALDLSLHTVKRHVANILGKLGAETRGQAAALFNARQR